MQKNEKVEKELEDSDLELDNKVSETVIVDENNESKKIAESENSNKESQQDEKSKKSNEKVDEATVIEKIKNFLAKIASMQEETKKENDEKKEEKKLQQDAETDKKEVLKKKPKYMLEYYDLPYRYNETVVKVLAQTPKKLFVYWDISDNDREKYLKAFGDDFFYKTYPVLLLYNEDKEYVEEIPVNDFANSWYIDIQDPKTKYIIQLGRKFISNPEIVNMAEFKQNNIILQTDYLPFANSNIMEAPNDHVLFETLSRFILFRNVKTNEEVTKDLRNFNDIFGHNYNVKEFYEKNYQDELSEGMFDMKNPSSKMNSSVFK